MSHPIALALATALSLSTAAPGGALASSPQETADKAIEVERKELHFPSLDKLELTADLYTVKGEEMDKERPFILLCHQAGVSRGEYRDVAPLLVERGFNCLAIDQRSGGDRLPAVKNEVAKAAKAKGLSRDFFDARQDIVAAARYARKELAQGAFVLCGSSYSAALVTELVGSGEVAVDALLAFSPGEYIAKDRRFVSKAIPKVDVPTFITGMKVETSAMLPELVELFELGDRLTFFEPETRGNHGAAALWPGRDHTEEYWKALDGFFKTHEEALKAKPEKAEEKAKTRKRAKKGEDRKGAGAR